jgi:SAM-dependent methyltransferase/nicotinamide mononucleotide adenylyltransferase
MIALLLGRFHALTRGQADLVASLVQEVNSTATVDATVERIVCVITSSDHSGTRRNPLDADTREALLRPLLMATGKPFDLVRVADIADDSAWVAHVRAAVRAQAGVVLEPASTTLVSANRDVQALFGAAGYRIAAAPAGGLTPHELIQRIVDKKEWKSEAAPSTIDVFAAREVTAQLQRIFGDTLRTDDGELSSHRDFVSYGAQMDASLVQKVEDLLPWVLPPRIVDKGCGTGKLLVELSRRFPGASLVGVDLSREFLRRSDENTYAGGDVELVLGDAADQQLPDGSADTVIFSSIMHEVYSYSGYDRTRVDRALASAARELRRGGRLLIRDGISPDPRDVLLDLMDAGTAAQLERFAREFKHGQGVAFTAAATRDGAIATVRLSAHAANEFLCKKDYLKNWDIEVHEEYGVFTVDEWRAALARNFFSVRTITTYVNEWIRQNRYQGHVKVTELNGTSFWPATNAVIIGERQ